MDAFVCKSNQSFQRPLMGVLAILCMAGPVSASAMSVLGMPVPVAELAKLRGGFEAGGMVVKFGVEMTTYVNGMLASRSGIDSGPSGNTIIASQSTNVQQTMVVAQGSGVQQIVQVGNANQVSSGLLNQAASALSVVQNNLNNQVIQHATVINLDVSNAIHTQQMTQIGQTLQQGNVRSLNVP
ncbi:hypothetical protein [Acidithiobacillus ferrivorans]|nr:hypothetical protein [Acidithiobacillus ferrivorans]QQD72386.1 hypothetical protein H2515_13525 [Acidithiobacillus ferrivorans]